jgi:TetR/AcrR family transcriptional repressor of nem operon
MKTSISNAKTEQRERSHETILESAARLMRERGIAGTGVADVMKGAGLTVGGFYAHFGSKQALVDAALERLGESMRARLFARLDDKPRDARAQVVLKRYLSAAHRDAQSLGCPLPAVAGEIGTTAPEHATALAEQVDAIARELADLLPGTARRSRALALVALMVGGLMLARGLRGTALSDEMIRACRELGISAMK